MSVLQRCLIMLILFYMSRNLNKLNKNVSFYPKSSKIDFFEQKYAMHDCLEHSMSVDQDRRRRFESKRSQMVFFNDVP